MHIDITIHRALHLDGLCAVSFLRVQLTTVHLFYLHHITLRVLPAGVIRRGDNSLPSRIETEVCLVHELLVEAWIDGGVIVGDSLIVVVSSRALIHLGAVLEELVQDWLLLIIMNTHPFALDGTAMRSKRHNGNQLRNYWEVRKWRLKSESTTIA